MNFGAGERFDFLKIHSKDCSDLLARLFTKCIDALHSDLQPSAGSTAQIDNARSGNKETVLFVQFQDLKRSPPTIAFGLCTLYIRIVQLTLQPTRGTQRTAARGFYFDREVALTPPGGQAKTISRTNFRHMYYSAAQQLAHHASSGCSMETGDLLGSGTISGPTPDSYGSLLELTWNGDRPLDLGGVARTFLEDGDRVELTGWCAGAYRVGFGHCVGTILPAPEFGRA